MKKELRILVNNNPKVQHIYDAIYYIQHSSTGDLIAFTPYSSHDRLIVLFFHVVGWRIPVAAALQREDVLSCC